MAYDDIYSIEYFGEYLQAYWKKDGKTISVMGGEYWGWGGVNHTKNLVYDGCELTRYDAHAGLVNGKSSKIAPLDYTTRAEVAVLLKRVLDYIK